MKIIPVFLALLCVAAPSVAVAEETDEGPTSELSGRIFTEAGNPVAGARVLAYHLSTEQVYESGPTSGKGEYRIGDLPYGYFDLAIETADGLYPANQVVNVAPSSKAVLSFTLYRFSDAVAGEEVRRFPGTEQRAIGVARVNQKLRGGDFWRSPRGVGTLAGIGGAILLLIAGGGSTEGEASPSTP